MLAMFIPWIALQGFSSGGDTIENLNAYHLMHLISIRGADGSINFHFGFYPWYLNAGGILLISAALIAMPAIGSGGRDHVRP